MGLIISRRRADLLEAQCFCQSFSGLMGAWRQRGSSRLHGESLPLCWLLRVCVHFLRRCKLLDGGEFFSSAFEVLFNGPICEGMNVGISVSGGMCDGYAPAVCIFRKPASSLVFLHQCLKSRHDPYIFIVSSCFL